MSDVLGYNVQSKVKDIVTSEHAVLSTGKDGQQTNLVQQVNVQYGHRVETKYEGGSSNVYFVNGQPSGQMTVARMVGKYGFLDSLVATNISTLKNFSLQVNKEKIAIRANEGLSIEGIMFVNAGIAYGMGAMEVSENANYIFTKLARTGAAGGGLLGSLISGGLSAAQGNLQQTAAGAIGL